MSSVAAVAPAAAPLAAVPALPANPALHADAPTPRPSSLTPSAPITPAPESEPTPEAVAATAAPVDTATATSTTDVLPPYTRSAAPPPYIEREEVGEPNTLAKQLFCYGFFFPLFFFVGASILMSNLTPPASWEETKTEEERTKLIAVLRATEVKWAKRCLYASIAFLFLIAAIAVLAVMVPRLHH